MISQGMQRLYPRESAIIYFTDNSGELYCYRYCGPKASGIQPSEMETPLQGGANRGSTLFRMGRSRAAQERISFAPKFQ